jgi:uncharacterized protein (DUF3084 family)
MYQWPIWLVIMLVCGLIAYMGDTLGRTLGKRRLSLLGLRPKQTARVFTSVTGCFIFLVSLGSLVTLSKEHRQWIVQGPEVVKQLQRQQQEVREKNAELQTLTDAIARADERLGRVTAKLRAAEAEREKIRGEQQRLQKDYARTSAHLQDTMAQLRTAESDLKARNEEVRDLSARRSELETQVADLGAQAADREAEIVRLDSSVRAFEKELDTLGQQNQRLEADNLKLEGENEELQAKNEELALEEARLQTRIQVANYEIEQLESAAARWGSSVMMLATAPILFNVGHEVCRLPVEGGGTTDECLRHVDAIMEMARRIAVQAGATPGPDGLLVTMLDRLLVNEDGARVKLTPDQVRQYIAAELQQREGEQVLIAYAGVNTVASQPLVVNLEVLDDPLVYRKGERIASVRIDQRDDDDTILTHIIGFFQNDVARAAQAEGMIPVAGSSRSLGEVTHGELYALLTEIRQARRDVTVTAFAKADTRAADPLEIGFEVRAR